MNNIENLVIKARDGQLTATQRHFAFGELVAQFQDTAFGWAFAVLDDAHLAQDAVQEAFVSAYQNLEQLRQPVAFSGWFKQIVVSQCHRFIRSKQLPMNSIETTADIPTTEPAPETAVEDVEIIEKIMAAIQALPEKEQIVTYRVRIRPSRAGAANRKTNSQVAAIAQSMTLRNYALSVVSRRRQTAGESSLGSV